MTQNSWREEITKSSRFLSIIGFCIGVWLALVSIVNILVGAFAPGQKIEWIGFFDGSSLTEAYSNHNSVSVGSGDMVAIALAIALIFVGARGLEATTGTKAFLKSIAERPGRMVSTTENINALISNWLIVGGALLYLGWSVVYTTWVDPGIYSVCIALIASGAGLEAISEG